MASVSFRFSNEKSLHNLACDGTSITAADFKHKVIELHGLDESGQDVGIIVTDAASGQCEQNKDRTARFAVILAVCVPSVAVPYPCSACVMSCSSPILPRSLYR